MTTATGAPEPARALLVPGLLLALLLAGALACGVLLLWEPWG